MENNKYKLQALLYANGGEIAKSEIAKLIGLTVDEVNILSESLRDSLRGQGLVILITEKSISMRTNECYNDFIEHTQKKNCTGDIGTAGMEVLSIVLYKDGANRSEIDYIRGVNSSSTLRQMVLRGLLEKIITDNSLGAKKYIVTPELLSYLGISSVNELPDYTDIQTNITDKTITNTEHELK